jgi:pyrroline-5-carboxylate reductase
MAPGVAIALAGCGKMGSALVAGWLAAGIARRVDIVDPALAAAPGDGRVRLAASPSAIADPPDAVVLAVKPQVMASVLPAWRPLARPGTVILSIAAGTTIAGLRAGLGEGAAVVRAMPNTPAAIGQGASVLVAGPGVDAAQRDLCGRLLAAVGSVDWVEDEGLMDAVTAVSGSGPAYVFLLIEALAAAAEGQGLPPDLAMRLARRTVTGAGALAAASTESAAELRRNVTSPGGTTAAALAVLGAPDGLSPLMARAVEAAARRSRELAG